MDPTHPPQTLDELRLFAEALEKWETAGGRRRLIRAGYLPVVPPWFLAYISYWFGGQIFDEQTGKFTLTSPENVAAYEWIRSYSQRLGTDSVDEFQGSLGSFQSTQNPFLTEYVAMLQQGPWTANFVEKFAPDWNRWRIPATRPAEQRVEEVRDWKARETQLAIQERRKHYQWGAAPFPAGVAGLQDVTFAGFDVLVIPRTARHKEEAFEFLAFVNRQDIMEKLCSMHCKNSPLREVSETFIRNHPNPYIGEFQRMVAGPNAFCIPRCPIWTEVEDELKNVRESVFLLKQTPEDALAAAQHNLQKKYDRFVSRQADRGRAE